MENLKDVFEHELKDIYSAENQILKALPKMVKGAVNDNLREAFETHLEETQGHVQRLEQIAQMCNVNLRGQKCKGMEGLLAEGGELLEQESKNEVRDAALIPDAQRVEHYEMAAYGSAIAFAKTLNLSEAESLLQQTLAEEKNADAKLSEIAEQMVNISAMGEGVHSQGRSMNMGQSSGSKTSGRKS